jgi:hypothetical protein
VALPLAGAAALNAQQPFLLPDVGSWTEVRDGNLNGVNLFSRHYSKLNYRSKAPTRFVGPGRRMVLLSSCARALFVWRLFDSKDPTAGADDINCAIFRNEGAGRSSDLILDAMNLAFAKWGRRRLYTYVNPKKVCSSNPGYCFLMAGWRRCGVTKSRNLIVLEHLPEWELLRA